LGKNFLMKLESSVARQYGNSSAYESHASPYQDHDDDDDDDARYHAPHERSSLNPHTQRHPHSQAHPTQQPRSQRTRETINIPQPQRNGTQLYQSHKKNLKPVNRPSMAQQQQRGGSEEYSPGTQQPRQGGTSINRHSPIKAQRSSVSASGNGSGGTDSRFQHLLQPTSSSANRISRQSNVRSNDAEEHSPQGRARSPRR
jgi:hypothetical protein